MIKAIVYTSNTGTTREYARLLSETITLPYYSLSEAQDKLKKQTEIIYLGWLMAGTIKGYKEAKKNYKICAVCGVGMGRTGTQVEEITKKENKTEEEEEMLDMILHGANKVSINNLKEVLNWYKE